MFWESNHSISRIPFRAFEKSGRLVYSHIRQPPIPLAIFYEFQSTSLVEVQERTFFLVTYFGSFQQSFLVGSEDSY